MAISMNENRVVFESVIYENEVVELRDFFQESAPTPLELNFEACQDAHMAILQLILAYQKTYECSYVFGENVTMYEKVIKGFDLSEDHCN